MIAVPAVHGTLDLVAGDGGDNCPGSFSMMCLSGSKLVEWSKVNYAAGTSVRLWTDDHAMAPHHWVVNRNFLKDSKVTVTVQASLDISLPVNGYVLYFLKMFFIFIIPFFSF